MLTKALKILMSMLMMIGIIIAVVNFSYKEAKAAADFGTWYEIEGLPSLCMGEASNCVDVYPSTN